jgi:hypothetical protein
VSPKEISSLVRHQLIVKQFGETPTCRKILAGARSILAGAYSILAGAYSILFFPAESLPQGFAVLYTQSHFALVGVFHQPVIPTKSQIHIISSNTHYSTITFLVLFSIFK